MATYPRFNFPMPAHLSQAPAPSAPLAARPSQSGTPTFQVNELARGIVNIVTTMPDGHQYDFHLEPHVPLSQTLRAAVSFAAAMFTDVTGWVPFLNVVIGACMIVTGAGIEQRTTRLMDKLQGMIGAPWEHIRFVIENELRALSIPPAREPSATGELVRAEVIKTIEARIEISRGYHGRKFHDDRIALCEELIKSVRALDLDELQ